MVTKNKIVDQKLVVCCIDAPSKYKDSVVYNSEISNLISQGYRIVQMSTSTAVVSYNTYMYIVVLLEK